jgi:hypothetical protein
VFVYKAFNRVSSNLTLANFARNGFRIERAVRVPLLLFLSVIGFAIGVKVFFLRDMWLTASGSSIKDSNTSDDE